MKEKIIIIISIILLIIIILLVSFSVNKITNYFSDKKLQEVNEKLKQVQILKEKIQKEKEEKDKLIIEQNKRIEQLKKQKVITKIEYITLTDPEKEKAYNNLIDIHNEALSIIEESKVIQNKQDKIIEEQGQIIQTDEQIIEKLKGMINTKKGILIEPFVLAGIKYKDINDSQLTLGIGGVISKVFDFKLFTFGIGGGGYGKIPVDNEKEFGAIIQFKIGW